MPQIATPEEWRAARNALLEREQEVTRLNEAVTKQRQQLPWVRVEKAYRFDTDAGPRTLAELFAGRSQLLVYHLMYGASFKRGACPGCSNLADHFDGGLVHLQHRDVTFLAMSRAPLEMLQAYKRRMGWRFPWVSSYGSDFQHDFGFAETEDELRANPETRAIIEDPDDFMREWSESTGADVASGLAEGPGWNVFALDGDVVYHTYSRHAPGGDLLGPYYNQLLDLTPKGRPDAFPMHRNDEYGDGR